jgi:hypothetical protein
MVGTPDYALAGPAFAFGFTRHFTQPARPSTNPPCFVAEIGPGFRVNLSTSLDWGTCPQFGLVAELNERRLDPLVSNRENCGLPRPSKLTFTAIAT